MDAITQITLVDCQKIPPDAMDHLMDRYDYGGHYQSDVLQIYDDGGAFSEWLKSEGYKFKSKPTDEINNFDEIAFLAT